MVDLSLLSDEQFGYWLAGFTAGEGHFGAGLVKKKSGGPSDSKCIFWIRLRDDDEAVLQAIKARLGIGFMAYKLRKRMRPGENQCCGSSKYSTAVRCSQRRRGTLPSGGRRSFCAAT